MHIGSTTQSARTATREFSEPGPMEESILDAVERVIARRGVTGTTLEAMAAEAGFSKGGLLHYFPSKQAILFRLIDRMQKRLEKARHTLHNEYANQPTTKAKATIDSFINMIGTDSYGMHNVAELLADPDIRAHVAANRARLFKEISQGSMRPERIAMAMMMADGFWLDNFMEESAFPLDVRTRTMELVRDFLSVQEKDFTPQTEQHHAAEGA